MHEELVEATTFCWSKANSRSNDLDIKTVQKTYMHKRVKNANTCLIVSKERMLGAYLLHINRITIKENKSRKLDVKNLTN